MKTRQFRLTLSGLALAAMFIGGLVFAQSAPKPIKPDHPAQRHPVSGSARRFDCPDAH